MTCAYVSSVIDGLWPRLLGDLDEGELAFLDAQAVAARIVSTDRFIYHPVSMDGRTTRHAHRRPQLVLAAADWIVSNGLDELSLRSLAAGVGVSHATLLHHFGTKEQLLVEVLAEFRGRQRLMLAASASDSASPGLTALLWATWRRLTSPEAEPFLRLVFELAGVGVRRPERVQGFLHGVVEDWTSSIRLLLEREGMPPDAAARLATVVYAALRGLLLDVLTTGERDRVERGVRELADLLEARLAAIAAQES